MSSQYFLVTLLFAYHHISRLTSIKLIKNESIDGKDHHQSTPSLTFKFIAFLLILQSSLKYLIPLRCLSNSRYPNGHHDSKSPSSSSSPIDRLMSNHSNLLSTRLLQLPRASTNEGKCLFCFSSPPVSPTVPICGHIFCWDCIVQWCITNPACPMCR